MSAIFITGIGTGIGKTIVTSVLCHALQSDYWKPIQSGIDSTDSEFIRSVTDVHVHQEVYLLKEPISPHASAKLEGIEIDLDKIVIPNYKSKYLFIEGVGGIMSPINDNMTNLDLIHKLNIPVVIVISNYLGSINHSMLTLESLRMSNQNILGFIVSGQSNKESEQFIIDKTGVPRLAYIPKMQFLDKSTISLVAKKLEISCFI